ncbi:carboxyl-terminal protease [Pseudoalteromonas rubra]|uniref:Carboxyl-terminal protease n=1 Tax=Pseudoalteromonas rubra TaxID=43658 RepID=A0A5S3WQL4_9GAMM|nr:S41 family peptidase [Pseudoalteromonas rubra]TMP30005.1 carboxyl-terminal protease [Pseudoalteromonas rubra]TMP30585.1 carboxyl-terminal protease [Pseudoalteromonas rubra]
MKQFSSLYLAIGLALSTSALTGCGGGGTESGTGSNTGNVTTPTDTNSNGGNSGDGSTAPSWQAGVFAPASNFINFCANPRSGVDQFNNNQPFPDKAGTVMHEKMWLRSFSHETYLWYDELPDNNPQDFNSVAEYFAQLRTTQRNPDGSLKDQFHYSETYESYQKESQSGVTTSYGIRWAAIETAPPRNFTIAYVEPNSPAAQSGLTRGDSLLSIDGLDFINSDEVAQLNEALFPTETKAHTFVFRSVQGDEKSAEMTAIDFALSPVQNAKYIDHGGKRVGYVQFNQFIASAQGELIDAFNGFIADGVNELVLDMRYNGGGLIHSAAQLGYMIAGDSSLDRNFGVTTYNAKRQGNNRIYTFEPRQIDWAREVFLNDTTLPTLNLSRVYVLTTDDTASASEMVINGLRGIDVEVVQIGTTTRGKPYGFLPAPNCGMVYYTIQSKSANEKGFGDYADGFTPTPASQISGEAGLDARVPGCRVNDDFGSALGDENERLLATALHHSATGSCLFNDAPQGVSARPGDADTSHAVTLPFRPLRDGAIHATLEGQ